VTVEKKVEVKVERHIKKLNLQRAKLTINNADTHNDTQTYRHAHVHTHARTDTHTYLCTASISSSVSDKIATRFPIKRNSNPSRACSL
jgi:diadenosine tetraphosphate (Ap4A) HIT family hydrolase